MHGELIVSSKVKEYSVSFIADLDPVIHLMQDKNTITFVDSNVLRLYPVLNTTKANIISIDCVEPTKSLEGVVGVCSKLIANKANIKTKLIVIGGGILQDLIGFCASIYYRGITYIHVPTTLLAQADSCVGGKTSINFENKKNMLGTFYPPEKILIHTNFLNTLSDLDYISGLGEVYKFHILRNKINEFNFGTDVREMIYEGLRYKIDILQRDEFDRGERKFLNYGHTFGHALETISNNTLPHGIAVILGCMIATLISKHMGNSVSDLEQMLLKGSDLIQKSGIELSKDWFDFQSLLPIIRADKKNTDGITMVLMNNGVPVLKTIEDLNGIQKILDKVYEII